MSENHYDRIEIWAGRIVRWASSSYALLILMVLCAAWLVSGFIFGFSMGWQAAMSVPATAVTFLLVFLILRAQSKDTQAIQLKLNEIIAALSGANNQLIDIENTSERDLKELHKRYETVAIHINSDKTEGTSTDTIVPHELAEEITHAAEEEKEIAAAKSNL